jgi:hypothetical protein
VLAEHIGCSPKAIAHRVHKLRLVKVVQRRWTAAEIETVRDGARTGRRLDEVAREVGRHPSEVSKKAADAGLQFRKRRKGVDRNGHVVIGFRRSRTNGRTAERILEHRQVMEDLLGRHLTSSERVHHVNQNKQDNRPSNLFLCESPAEHQRAHRSLDKLVPGLLERGIIRFNRSEGVYELCATGR